jgi:hypothetical protein
MRGISVRRKLWLLLGVAAIAGAACGSSTHKTADESPEPVRLGGAVFAANNRVWVAGGILGDFANAMAATTASSYDGDGKHDRDVDLPITDGRFLSAPTGVGIDDDLFVVGGECIMPQVDNTDSGGLAGCVSPANPVVFRVTGGESAERLNISGLDLTTTLDTDGLVPKAAPGDGHLRAVGVSRESLYLLQKTGPKGDFPTRDGYRLLRVSLSSLSAEPLELPRGVSTPASVCLVDDRLLAVVPQVDAQYNATAVELLVRGTGDGDWSKAAMSPLEKPTVLVDGGIACNSEQFVISVGLPDDRYLLLAGDVVNLGQLRTTTIEAPIASISSSADGVVVTAVRGGDTVLFLERQADGSFDVSGERSLRKWPLHDAPSGMRVDGRLIDGAPLIARDAGDAQAPSRIQ